VPGLDLRDVDAFVVAADSGTFTAAAARLYTTQSSLSRRIARLEQEIGGTLFDRSNRRTPSLAPLGREILPHARQLVAEYGRFTELVRAQSQGRDGTITIAVSECVSPLVLPRFYELMSQRLPDVVVRILECSPGAGVRAAVLEGEAEVGFLDPQLMSADLEGVTFGVATHVALGLPRLLGDSAEPVEWSELRRLPLLLPVAAGDVSYPVVSGTLAVLHDRGGPATLLAMARAGHGVAILAGHLKVDGLSRRPVALSGTVQRIRIQLAWRRRSVLASPVRRLVADLRRRLATMEPVDLDDAGWGHLSAVASRVSE
jgi:DNA-binding transcriptional LysR family regulator